MLLVVIYFNYCNNKYEVNRFNMIEHNIDEEVKIKAEASYVDPAVRSLKQLKEWILISLGYPLVTVELTEEQLNFCIASGTELYTKYAYFEPKYLTVDLGRYEHGRGINLKCLNIASVKEIGMPRDNMFSQGGDIFWSPYAFTGQGQGVMPFGNNSNLPSMGNWVTWHAVNEYMDLVNRCTGSNPDFRYDRATGYLRLMPEPGQNRANNWMLITAQMIPEYEELYGNEYVRRICIAKAKILLGTIRKKFANVQLLGGGQLDTTIGDEGKEELDKILEEIITAESKAQCCFIV